MLPLTIQPRLPPAGTTSVALRGSKTRPTFGFVFRVLLGYFVERLPFLMERSRMRLESPNNFDDKTWSFCSASVAFECFSQSMWRTFTAVAALRPPLFYLCAEMSYECSTSEYQPHTLDLSSSPPLSSFLLFPFLSPDFFPAVSVDFFAMWDAGKAAEA